MSRPSTLASLAALIAISTSFLGATWYVYEDGSGDAPTIRAAVDSSSAGDSILVGSGTFVERVQLKPNVHLISLNGPQFTHLPAGIAVIGEPNDFPTLLKGFKFTGTPPGYGFDAIVELGTNHEISECSFEEIFLRGWSHWISLSGDGIIVRDCSFRDNQNAGHLRWPGVMCSGEVTVERCLFQDNFGFTTANITAFTGSDLTVRDCVFLGTDDYGLPGIIGWQELTVEGCFFEGVTFPADQPMIRARGNSDIRNNTFVEGRSAIVGGLGSHVNLHNNVFANTILALQLTDASVGAIACNLFWNNETDWEGIPDPTGVDGNVCANPLFCDPANGTYTVASNSPCLPENSNGCGLIGAFGQGCGVVSIDAMSWGGVKALYR